MTENPNEFSKIVEQAQNLPDERQFYFNGFSIQVAPPDVTIILHNNNKPIAHLNTSHVIAKTLVKLLGSLLNDFEKKTDYIIPTLDELAGKKDDGE